MSTEPRPKPDSQHLKRAPRVEGCHPATLVTSDGKMVSVTVTDLSSGGFKVEGAEMLRIGEYVGLRVERYGEFPAQIRWVLDDKAGGVFLRPIVLPEGD